MAHGGRSRVYDLAGSSAARAFRTAMAGVPLDGPRQERAEGRSRCARGIWPNQRTGMAKRNVVGCRQRNREGASRSAESRGMVGIGRDGMGRTWRGLAGAGRHTASWRMVEMGTCGRGQSNSRSPRAGPSKNPTTHSPPYTVPRSRSPLARGRVETPVSPRASSATGPFSHTLTHTVPRYRSPLARGRTGNPPVPLRGGVGRPASPRASSATRPLSPPGFGSVRFGSVRFGSVRLVSSPAPPRRPPTIGEVDREEPHRPRL